MNISSFESETPFIRGIIPYEIAKSGVNMLTKALAKEWGYKGISVNGVAPGYTSTEMVTQMAEVCGLRDAQVRRAPA